MENKPTRIYNIEYDPDKIKSIKIENHDGTFTYICYEVFKNWNGYESTNGIYKIAPKDGNEERTKRCKIQEETDKVNKNKKSGIRKIFTIFTRNNTSK